MADPAEEAGVEVQLTIATVITLSTMTTVQDKMLGTVDALRTRTTEGIPTTKTGTRNKAARTGLPATTALVTGTAAARATVETETARPRKLEALSIYTHA